MSTAQRLTPERLPDPWLVDTTSLVSELARVRGLALNIPAVRNDILGPITSGIDALWDLEQRLRYCFLLHCEAQRDFAKKHTTFPRTKSLNNAGTPHRQKLVFAAGIQYKKVNEITTRLGNDIIKKD